MTAADHIPTFPSVIVGYRSWLVFDNDDALCPLFAGSTTAKWQAGVNEAKCFMRGPFGFFVPPSLVDPPKHDIASHECVCGYHAYHEPSKAMRTDHVKGRVCGAVAMWGTLGVHVDGVRSQFAQVLALMESKQFDDDRMARIAERYGVPIVPLTFLELEAERHGKPIPVEYRPEKVVPQPKPKPQESAPSPGVTVVPGTGITPPDVGMAA